MTLSEKVALSPFFENRTLDIARVKRVPLIENPGFYVDDFTISTNWFTSSNTLSSVETHSLSAMS